MYSYPAIIARTQPHYKRQLGVTGPVYGVQNGSGPGEAGPLQINRLGLIGYLMVFTRPPLGILGNLMVLTRAAFGILSQLVMIFTRTAKRIGSELSGDRRGGNGLERHP